MLEIKNLSKSFGSLQVLKNINLNIEKGESVVIVGGSGCGKSTLLRCINRLILPDEGEIIFNGQNLLDPKIDIAAMRRRIGMVYQHFNLFEHLNVMENLILAPMTVLHMTQDEAVARAETLLERVGMENRRCRMPNQLSGGQKQRVAIARSLMMEPDILLFDEPTSALDPTMVDEVESVIRKLVGNGMTSVIVTHEMRFAEKIASNVVFLAEKGIYESAPPKQFFHSPKRELTRQFIYRSRMFEKNFTLSDFDPYALTSELSEFALPFGLTRRQTTAISYLTEELLIPVLKQSKSHICKLYLVCDSNGAGHKLLLEFPAYCDNNWDSFVPDPISLQLLRGYTSSLRYELRGTAYEAEAVF